jgi:hypothetical protein
VPFEALDEPARLGGGEGFVERGGLVGVEVVLHQHDLRRVGKMHVRQIPEHMGIFDGGAPLSKSIAYSTTETICQRRRSNVSKN